MVCYIDFDKKIVVVLHSLVGYFAVFVNCFGYKLMSLISHLLKFMF